MEIKDTHEILSKYHKISGTNKGIDESFKKWVAVDDIINLKDDEWNLSLLKQYLKKEFEKNDK